MISMVERLHTNPARYGWNGAQFWCPFRTGHIGPRSRMAVAAQVILVTGEHPTSQTAELYSINFSFGTLDRSWHWRRFPAAARYFDGTSLWTPVTTSLAGDERVPPGSDACVYPQTVRLREDMTICVQGRGPSRGGVEVGCWYQRYLPSTTTTLPPQALLGPGQESAACASLQAQIRELEDKQQVLLELKTELNPRDPENRLEIARLNREIKAIAAQIDALKQERTRLGCGAPISGERPSAGYSHAWKFLPQSLFALADRFSHFGVYDTVDSRSQYYLVSGDAALLEAGQAGAWIDDAGQLTIDAYPFRFDWMRLPWPPKVPPATAPKARPSLFNPDVRLRIVRRGAQWIAMHWDKRDDDLMPFARLPQRVTLKFRRGPELKDGAGSLPDATITLAPGNSWIKQPPGVRSAYFKWETTPTRQPIAVLGFVPSRAQTGLDNVWRVRAAALDPATGQAISLIDAFAENFTPAGTAFERRWSPSTEEYHRLREYCSADGAARYATSVWFENAVGHVSVSDDVPQWPHAAAQPPIQTHTPTQTPTQTPKPRPTPTRPPRPRPGREKRR